MTFKDEDQEPTVGRPWGVVHIENDRATITLDDLCCGCIPGRRNPPWQLQEGITGSIEGLINQKGLSVDSFRLEGHITLGENEEIPVIVKAVERKPGVFQFYAFPKNEEMWLVVEEDPPAFTD